MRVMCFLALFFCHSITWASHLSASEQQMRDYIHAQQQNQIHFLQKLVNINSGTMNIKGVQKIAAIMRVELEKLGFKVKMIAEPKEMARASTLIAQHGGHKGKKILLIGHLDTVFPKDSTFQKFELHGNTAKGPGVIDDKGGLVVMLYALKAMQAAHVLENTNITIVLTGDEEDSGKPSKISRRPLIDAAQQQDVALDFEPTITLQTATIARRGISNWQITTHGNQSHSATIFLPEVGAGAIFELARILNTMRTELEHEKYLSFNPGVVLGGTTMNYDAKSTKGTAFGKQNVVASTALVAGDVRYISEEQKKSVENKMTKIVNQHLTGTKATITFQDGIPAMSPSANNLALLQQYSAVSEALDQGAIKPLDPGVRGAGDISHIANIVPANLAGLGPMGIGTHAIIESIELPSLPIQTERAAILMYRLTQ